VQDAALKDSVNNCPAKSNRRAAVRQDTLRPPVRTPCQPGVLLLRLHQNFSIPVFPDAMAPHGDLAFLELLGFALAILSMLFCVRW
jgi:hypothetical protein